jgi:hypothetical protein
MICGAEACNLGAMIHGAELRVYFLKSFQKGSTCENLSHKGLKSKKKTVCGRRRRGIASSYRGLRWAALIGCCAARERIWRRPRWIAAGRWRWVTAESSRYSWLQRIWFPAGHRHLLHGHHPPSCCAPARTPSSTPRSRPVSLADRTSCLSKNLAAAVVEWFHLHPPSRFPLAVPPVAPPHGSRHPHCHSYPQVCNILTMVFRQSWSLFCNLLSISLMFLEVFSNKYVSRGPMLLFLLLVPC